MNPCHHFIFRLFVPWSYSWVGAKLQVGVGSGWHGLHTELAFAIHGWLVGWLVGFSLLLWVYTVREAANLNFVVHCSDGRVVGWVGWAGRIWRVRVCYLLAWAGPCIDRRGTKVRRKGAFAAVNKIGKKCSRKE